MSNLKMTFGAVAIAAALATSPSQALCDLCNASVRLNEDLANCFLERAEAEAERLASSGTAFILIDLSDCDSRGGLPTGAPLAEPEVSLDDRFIADAQSLPCLSAAITESADGIGAGHVFDLAALCG
ncbi:MAG: F-BAR domain-containing protein [Devosia sp.]